MTQVTARLPNELAEALDAAAERLQRSRAFLIRLALQRYLEDFDDLTVAVERLQDGSDAAVDWTEVRSGARLGAGG